VSEHSGTFSNTTGEDSFFRIWRPPGEPRAGLLLVHGLGEHSGRYQHLAKALADNGITVYGYDHQGHGHSGGRTGWVASFDDFLDDLATFHRRVIDDNGSRPLFMLGHSMGGLITTAYLLERPLKPDFVILSGPAIVPILDPGDPTIDPSRLSKDEAIWEAYLSDPLVLRERVTQELYVRLAEGLKLLPTRAAEIDLPILLIHGGADQICSAEGARLYVEGCASHDKTIKIYADGRHEMFNETNRDEVIADLWEWMEARLR